MKMLSNVESLGVFVIILLLALYFWRKVLSLYLFFVPEFVKVSGSIVEICKETYMDPVFFPSGNIVEMEISFPISYCTREEYFIRVRSNADEDVFYLIKVDKSIYESVEVAKEVEFECKKYSWDKYLVVKKKKASA